MNDKIIKTVTEALRGARSIEELAKKLLERGTVFREGREFIRVEEREQLWCEDCARFKGGPDGEGICLGDGQPTWYGCSVCWGYISKRQPADCISRSELLGIIDRTIEESKRKDSLTALRLFRETVEGLRSVAPKNLGETEYLALELEAMRSAANSYKIHNEKLTSENERLRCVIKILEADVDTRDRLLEAKVEEVYPEFMRDYKQIREELEEIYKENDNAEDNDKHDN